MTIRKIASLAFAAMIGATIMVSSASAAIELKWGEGASDGTPPAEAAKAMAEYINTNSNGKYHLSVYTFYKLGNTASVMKMLQMGSAHFCHDGSPNFVNFTPALGIFDMPYAFPSPKAVEYLIHGDAMKRLAEMCSNKTVTYLDLGANSFRGIFTSKPIKTLDEARKIKIRTTPSKVHTESIKLMGIAATPMPASEVYTGVQQGVIDGFDVDWINAEATKWVEVAPNFFESNHMYTPYCLVTSTKWWNGLSSDDKKLFNDALVVYKKICDEKTAEMRQKAMDRCIANGATRFVPSEEENKRWIEAAMPARKLLNEKQIAFFEEIQKLLKEAGIN